MPDHSPLTTRVDEAANHPRMFARSFGRPGPGTPLIHDDLTKSATWAAIEEVLLTLRQYTDATVTVSVLGTVVEYSRQPFGSSPHSMLIDGPASSPSIHDDVVDLRGL